MVDNLVTLGLAEGLLDISRQEVRIGVGLGGLPGRQTLTH
jgi:hypothetical protein